MNYNAMQCDPNYMYDANTNKCVFNLHSACPPFAYFDPQKNICYVCPTNKQFVYDNTIKKCVSPNDHTTVNAQTVYPSACSRDYDRATALCYESDPDVCSPFPLCLMTRGPSYNNTQPLPSQLQPLPSQLQPLPSRLPPQILQITPSMLQIQTQNTQPVFAVSPLSQPLLPPLPPRLPSQILPITPSMIQIQAQNTQPVFAVSPLSQPLQPPLPPRVPSQTSPSILQIQTHNTQPVFTVSPYSQTILPPLPPRPIPQIQAFPLSYDFLNAK